MLDVFLEDWALDRFRSIDRLTVGNTDKTTWPLVDREEEENELRGKNDARK